MIAGSLEIQLIANVARLQKDMDDARRVVGGAMSSISNAAAVAKGALIGLGAVGLAASFANSIKSAINLADDLNKMSQRAGVTTEALSQLQYAAKLSGSSAEGFSTAIKRLNLSIAASIAGDKEKTATFKALGVTLTDTEGRTKSADQVLLDISDTFAKSRDGASKTAAAVSALGKTGDELIPLLNGGSGAIRQMMQEADKLGLTIGTDFAKQAEEFNDNLARIQTASQKVAISLASDLVGGLGKAMQAMADATIQGGKLSGVIAGIQTLLTGDDLYKANVATVKGTELVMATEAALEKARASGDLKRVARLQSALDLRKQELATDSNYRKSLEATQEKQQKAADTVKSTLSKGPEIKLPTSGGTSAVQSEYDKLIQRIQTSISLNQEYLSQGRELTAAEKMRVSVLAEMDATKKKLSVTERAAIGALLDDGIAKENQVAIEKSQLDEAKRISSERQRMRNADYEAAQRFDESEREIENARNKSMRDTLQNYADEAAGLTITNAEREVSIRLREVERQGLVKGTEAYEEYAAKLKLAIGNKETISEATQMQVGVWQSIDSAAKNAFVNIGKNGGNVFDKLKDSLQSGLYALLYDMTVKKWLIQISTQINGAGVAQGAFGSSSGLSALGGLFKYGGSSTDASSANYVNSFDALSDASSGGFLANAKSILGFANGGNPPLGTPYMVGERGPELRIDNTPGTIIPNDKLGGIGGSSFTPTYNITVAGGIGAGEVAVAIQRAVAESNRQLVKDLQRNGVLQ